MSESQKPVIMIVDDEPININLLRDILIGKYKIIVSKNGKQALTLAEQKQPQVILLDIIMPEMDGFEVLEKLKDNKKTNHIPVIIISALTEIEDRGVGYDIGAADYISKPFDVSEVLARVRTQIMIQQLIQQNQNPTQFNNQDLEQLRDVIHLMFTNSQEIELFWSMIFPLIENHIDLENHSKLQDLMTNLQTGISDNIKYVKELNQLIQCRHS